MGKNMKTESVYQNGQIYKKETVTDKKGRETVTYYDSTGKKVDWNSIMNNSGTNVATPNNNGNNSVFGNGYSQEVTDLATNFYSSAMSQALTSGYNGNSLVNTTAGFFNGLLNLFGKGSSTPAPAANFQFNLGNIDMNAMVQQIMKNTQSTTTPTSATPAETTTPSATQPTGTTTAETTPTTEDLTKFKDGTSYTVVKEGWLVIKNDGTYIYSKDEPHDLLKKTSSDELTTTTYEYKKSAALEEDKQNSLKENFATAKNKMVEGDSVDTSTITKKNGTTYTYDKGGKLISMTEKNGKSSITTTFNPDGSVVIATTTTEAKPKVSSSSNSTQSSTSNNKKTDSAKEKSTKSKVPEAQGYCNENYKGSDGWVANDKFDSNKDSQTITFTQKKNGKTVQTVEVTAEKGQLKSTKKGSPANSIVTTFYTNSDSSLSTATTAPASLKSTYTKGKAEYSDGNMKKFTYKDKSSNSVWNFDESGKLSSYVKTETPKTQHSGLYGYYIITIKPSKDGTYYTKEEKFIYQTPPATDAKGMSNSFSRGSAAWKR